MGFVTRMKERYLEETAKEREELKVNVGTLKQKYKELKEARAYKNSVEGQTEEKERLKSEILELKRAQANKQELSELKKEKTKLKYAGVYNALGQVRAYTAKVKARGDNPRFKIAQDRSLANKISLGSGRNIIYDNKPDKKRKNHI